MLTVDEVGITDSVTTYCRRGPYHRQCQYSLPTRSVLQTVPCQYSLYTRSVSQTMSCQYLLQTRSVSQTVSIFTAYEVGITDSVNTHRRRGRYYRQCYVNTHCRRDLYHKRCHVNTYCRRDWSHRRCQEHRFGRDRHSFRLLVFVLVWSPALRDKTQTQQRQTIIIVNSSRRQDTSIQASELTTALRDKTQTYNSLNSPKQVKRLDT